MGKVSIAEMAKAPSMDPPKGFVGKSQAQTLFGRPRDHFRVVVHQLDRGSILSFEPGDVDCLAFVWKGEVDAADVNLVQGSSFIVEHGASLAVTGCDEYSLLVTFDENGPPATIRPGGNVHLLPNERVPRIPNMHKVTGITGALHADSTCPTCELWLHENHMPAEGLDPRHIRNTGIHSHTEGEVIFVTEGRIQLGQRLYGPGTAISVDADTLYGFSAGPEGVGFINFRATLPQAVQFPDGRVMEEAESWQGQLETKLEYITISGV